MKYEIAGKIVIKREIVPHSRNSLCNNIADIAGTWQGLRPARERTFQKNKEFGPGQSPGLGRGLGI